MKTLFGKQAPSASDIRRKTVGILVTAETEAWLSESAERFRMTQGTFVGLLLESARSHPDVLELALSGKYAEDGRTKRREKILPGSDPPDNSLKMLLDIADEYERGCLKPEATVDTDLLTEVVVRLSNPGDYLDEEVDEAMQQLHAEYTLSEAATHEIEKARECRLDIIASWGDIAAKLLLDIERFENLCANASKARNVRMWGRKALMSAKELADFRKKIRASLRGSNIPSTLEDAKRMSERREGSKGRRPLLVVGGRQAS